MSAKKIIDVIGERELQDQTAFRIPSPLLKKFKTICERQNVSLSEGIRNLIQWAVENQNRSAE